MLDDKSGGTLRDIVVKETWMGGKKVWSLDKAPGGEGWVGKIADFQRDPLTELILAAKELVNALARLIEALSGLLRVIMEITRREYKVLTGQGLDEL
jgi:hypothetical protein